MVLISHAYKFIYMKNHKVAGSSIESFFGRFCCDPNEDYQYTDKIDGSISEFGIMSSRNNGENVGNWWMRIPASDIRKMLGDDKFDNYFKFCAVRNPWDLMVSKYFWDKKQKNLEVTFTDYITEKMNWESWTSWNVFTLDGKPICDDYIRYESLTEDIERICTKIGIEADLTKLPAHKQGATARDRSIHYSTFYDDVTKRVVEVVFKDYIDFFNYSFETQKTNEAKQTDDKRHVLK